jgi:hypothetical protein
MTSEQQAEGESKVDRLAAIEAVAGSFDGVWPEGWREELRNEWPE